MHEKGKSQNRGKDEGDKKYVASIVDSQYNRK